MCFGEKENISKEIPAVNIAAASVGFHTKTARRARTLVADAMQSSQEDSL